MKLKSLHLFFLIMSFNLTAKEQEQLVNHLELASLMLKDGNLNRAQVALSKVETSDEAIDLQRFYIISALLKIKQNDDLGAIDLSLIHI